MIVNSNNITDVYPEFKEIKLRIVRLTVWNLDGTTSEMKLYYPPFCWNGDCSNRAGQHLEEWCREMTRYYLQISHYQVDFGVVYQDGREEMCGGCFARQEVPEGKIFKTAKCDRGRWMTPEQLKADHNKKMQEYYDMQMSNGNCALNPDHKPKVKDKIYLN